MRSPYDILGVRQGAGDDEIRKAFRKLAKQWHPDMKPGDQEAEAKFKEINAAYDLLSDPARRARFDRGEIDAEGKERFEHAFHGGASRPGGFQEFHFDFGGGHGGGEDVEGIFSHLFGEHFAHRAGGMKARGKDVRARVTVDFLDAANGARRRVTPAGGRSLDVAIPAGLKDGQVLRLKGQGEPGLGGGPAGDLLLEVAVAPHKLFRRVGDDVHLDLPITLAEAVEGGRITVPTVSGRVAVTVPRGANSGTVLRLKGKGINGGDQLVTLRVALPEHIDDELARFLRDWSARHPYDPRAGL